MEEVVMEALSSHEPKERIQGAMELSRLSSKQKQKFVDKGIIHPLVSMLNSHELESTEAALLALLSLAYGSERNKIKIAKYGAVPIILMLLQCQQSDTLTELAITALFILSSCADNRLLIASVGTVPVLIEMIGEGGINVTLQAKLDAMATLQNLSTCNQIFPALVSSGLLIYLLQIIYESEKSSDLVEKAMALLERIVSLSEIALKRTATMNGAIQAIVETIEEGSPQCKEHAVGILLLILQKSRDKYRAIILREGVMPGLLQLSVDGTWRAKNLAQTLLLLLRDKSGNRSKAIHLENEIFEHIMERIDSEDDEHNATALSLVEQMIAKLSA